MFNVLITGKLDPECIERLQAEEDLNVDYRPDLPMSDIMAAIPDVHCLINRSETPVRKELLDAATNLKVVARAAVGIANIDVEYATEKGILVMNTPGRNTNSAAELTMGLLLAVTRKLTSAHATMQQGGWDRHKFSGTELLGKTIAILGLGNVGHRVAQFCNGFEMRVLAYDPYIPNEVFERHRAEKSTLETILKEADIISLHTPRNPETIGMIGAAEFSKMKDGVVIINAARGGIVEEQALLDALNSGKVAGAGIDTWDSEPMVDNPFKELPNVVMSPHIGASTSEAQYRIGQTIADQVPKALRGGVVDAPVNMPQIRMIEGNLMSSYVVLCERLGSFASQFVDFSPNAIECIYRGDINAQDCTLLRLAFLKGFLNSKHDYVSYVNAEQRAESIGIQVRDIKETNFTDYDSGVKFVLSADSQEHDFVIGGVVFSGPHPRITLVDGFTYEAAPEGTFLLARCRNKLGVLSRISQVLDENGCLIERIDFSHCSVRKRTMFMFQVPSGLTDDVLGKLRELDDIRMVQRITL